MSANNNSTTVKSPSHSLNVQHLEQLHHKSRENDYSPRSLVLSQKPPEYHETCRKLSSSSANATSTTDSANSNRQANQQQQQQHLPGSGIRNPHYTMHSTNSNTNSKYTVYNQKSPTTTNNSKQSNEIKPMRTHQQQQNSKHQSHSTGQREPISTLHDVTFSQQRTLVNLFQLYVIIVIILALVYAIYQFSVKQHPLVSVQQQQPDSMIPSESMQLIDAKQKQHQTLESFLETSSAKQSELEQKLQLMQKYIELMANDLQDTKERLREREKCHCSRPCVSATNMTQQYADGATWQHQCDICSCQSGKISCQPVKCPQLTNCDEPQQVAGQCCPVCLKKCKYNQMTLKHGQSFKPNEAPAKECTCFDGLIKCVPKLQSGKLANIAIASSQQQQQQHAANEPKRSPIGNNKSVKLNEIVSGHQRH